MPDVSVEKVALVLCEGLAPGVLANVSACIAAGLAASRPTWAGQALADAQGLRSVASSHLPIVVLRAEATRLGALVHTLAQRPGGDSARVCLFPAYAQAVHEARLYWCAHGQRIHEMEPLLGLGLAGEKRWVNSLVGSLPLLR